VHPRVRERGVVEDRQVPRVQAADVEGAGDEGMTQQVDGRADDPSARERTTVRIMCWTMWTVNETAAYVSIGDASATRRAARPRRKSVVRQIGQRRRIRRTPAA